MSRHRIARLVHGSSLSGDTLDANAEQAWRDEMLAHTRALRVQQKAWFDGDLFWKRLGVIATVTIPISAAIWRAIGIGRKRRRLGR